jgi:O-antigen/teichoic acid export membrane protein
MAVGAGNILLLVFSLASGVLSSRWLGPDARGIYVAATTWAAFIGVLASFGVPQSVVLDHGDSARLTRPLMAHVFAGTCLALLGSSLLVITTDSSLGTAGVIGFTLLAGASISSGIAAGLAQRSRKMRSDFQIARLAAPATSIVSMAALIGIGNRSPDTWLLVTGASAFAASGLGMAKGLEWHNFGRFSLLYDASFLRSTLGACGVALISQALYRQDNLVSATFMHHDRIAEYAVGSAAMTACVAAAQAAGMVLFSQLRNTSPHLIRQATWRGIRSSAVMAGAVGIPLAVLARPLVHVVYGAPFLPAVPCIQVLSIAAIPLAVDYTLANVLLSLGRAKELIVSRVATVILGTSLLAWLAPRAGLAAFSGATLGVYCGSVLVLATIFAIHAPPRQPQVENPLTAQPRIKDSTND